MKKLMLSLLAACTLAAPAMAKEEVESYLYSTSEARLLDFTPTVNPQALTVEVKVIGKRIHETITLDAAELSKRSFSSYDRTLENLRSYAVFITSGKYDCDLIVGARFNFEISNTGATIEMFGYPANFVNWGGNTTELKAAPVVDEDYGKKK